VYVSRYNTRNSDGISALALTKEEWLKKPDVDKDPNAEDEGWLLLIYRVASEPSSNRVWVWRELKRIGALYLQNCICIVPDRPDLREAILAVRDRIDTMEGSSNFIEIPRLSDRDRQSVISEFRALVALQYEEIVEECRTKFIKEIEFERFRGNYSFAEAEEISRDLDKIRDWFTSIQKRDWFDAPGRQRVAEEIGNCAELLDSFYEEVHARASEHAGGPDALESTHIIPPPEGPSTSDSD
jgi:hypothetical protein